MSRQSIVFITATRVMPFLLGAVLVVSDLDQCRADTPLGVQLPSRSTRLEDGRFQLKLSYPRAVAWFKKSLKRAKVTFEVTERVHKASVKYTHFRSLDTRVPWAHINVATYDGDVFATVLPPAKGSRTENTRRKAGQSEEP